MQVRQHHQKEQQVAAMTTARVLSNKGDCDQALDAAAIPNSFLLEPPAIAAALDPSEYEEENNNNVPCLMMLDD